MPEDLKLSQIGSSQLPPPFRGLHSPGVRKHCQIIFACYFRKSSISLTRLRWTVQDGRKFQCTSDCDGSCSSLYWAIQRSSFARVNALCNLSAKKSARGRSALPGRFLSRRCFTLCIIVEVETRIAKQYKCQYCCSCKNYRGKGMEGENKVSCVVFWLTRRSRVRRKNAFWGILKHEQQVIAYFQTHDYGPQKMPLTLANSLSPPSIVKKVRTGSKSSQGT